MPTFRLIAGRLTLDLWMHREIELMTAGIPQYTRFSKIDRSSSTDCTDLTHQMSNVKINSPLV